jgi:hypothetical protein
VKPERLVEGRADEGERITGIVEQMEREDEEAVRLEMEGVILMNKKECSTSGMDSLRQVKSS